MLRDLIQNKYLTDQKFKSPAKYKPKIAIVGKWTIFSKNECHINTRWKILWTYQQKNVTSK